MEGYEYLYINGHPAAMKDSAEHLAALLNANYTYRTIHTLAHKPLHVGTQLKLLGFSYQALFAGEFNPDTKAVEDNIAGLLYRNNAPSGSNLVRIIAMPDALNGEPAVYMFYEGPLMYQSYCVWHKPATALPLTYEIPFPAFKTAANRLCHDYARQYAASKGCTEVISVNYRDEAVSVGENPLFAVSGRSVFTADAGASVPQSAERLIGIELCEKAGLTVVEEGIPAGSLSDMEELFSLTPQGIISVGRVGKRLFAPTIVKTFEPLLREAASLEFL